MAQDEPRYQWSRSAGGKTVTVALSAEQFTWMKKAVATQRDVWEILLRMQQLSAEYMLQNLPNSPRRKKRFGLQCPKPERDFRWRTKTFTRRQA